jgi:hypothetical protein
LGAALLVFGLLPVYRILDTSGDAPFRGASVEVAETTLQYAWWGSLLVVLVAFVLAVLFSDGAIRAGKALADQLIRPKLPLFAAAVGVLAFLLALAVGELLYQGLYTNMDEIASAIQARYMANGQLAGPQLPLPEGWLVTNTLMVEEGWVSQYPPSHLGVMAFFYRLGIPRLVGPVLMGIMAWFLALSFPRLLPKRPRTARAGVVLVALSPFLLFLAGGALSHLTAGAAAAAVLYTSLKARDENAWWGLAVGASVGIMVMARPLIGLVLGSTFPLVLWGPRILQGRVGWSRRRAGATVAGGLPFAVLLGLYNSRLFGGITQFGYLAAFGANHRLGFHLDPWGYMYGLEAALAFSSIDLLAVGVQFLETPLPLTVIVGAFLLLGFRFPNGVGTVLAWALLPLAANAYYWFHDARMMFEAAPAWILLAVLGVAEIVSWSGVHKDRRVARRLGQGTAWAFVVSLMLAAAWGVPTRWGSYSWTEETRDRIQVPGLPSFEPALVFVHASWNERLSANLQGAGGMRQDSIVSALRRNTNCQLHHFSLAREERERYGSSETHLPEVDLNQAAEAPPGLMHLSLVEGMSIRTREGEALDQECMRQVQADRFGAVALAPLLWQGDLPGDERGGPMFVRDLGPEKNQQIRELFQGRTAFVFSPFRPGAPPEIRPYDQAMGILWGEES